METNIISPGAVEVELGGSRLIPGPRGETGEQGPRGYGVKSAVLNRDFTLTLNFEDGSSYTTASIRGAEGPKGEAGDTGPEGPRGPQGEKGDPFKYSDFTPEQLEALTGPTGPVGPRGEQGLTGDRGPAGPEGPQGKTGDTGSTGPKGDPGDVWVPKYDGESGNLSWEKNAEGDPEPANIRGPKGDPGPKGDRGPEGPAGPGSGDMVASTYDPNGKAEDIYDYADNAAKNAVKDVSAANVKFDDGQTFQQKLEAGTLKGDRGETGPAGPTGPAGKDGLPGETGPRGPEGPNKVGTATQTDITGLLKGNGSAVAQAVAGEDYIDPSTLTARLNRSDNVTAANTNYSTYMVRAVAAGTEAPSSLADGCVYLVYEE